VRFDVRYCERRDSISKRAPSNTRSTDQQLTLWKFDSTKWLVS